MSNTTIVALRGSTQHKGRRFVCPVNTWEFLRDLGQTFGWHPRGATYVTSSKKQSTLPVTAIRHNYQAGDIQDCKQIETADAVEWASALDLAKRSSHLRGMIRAHAALVRSGEKALLDMVDEFIDFAHSGAFVFALCEKSDGPARTAPESIARASS